MNQTTRYVMEIYQVAVVIRDTLEYVVKKDDYNVEAYRQRKLILTNALSENHAFAKFLSENGDAGKKIRENMENFIELVYGDEPHAVFEENDKVVVRDGYTVQVIDYVVGLHETIFDILNGFITFAKQNNTYEDSFGLLLKKGNEFYRCLAGLIISDQLHALFVEFNKAKQEAKGADTPTSNFIGNDLKKCIGFFKFVEERAQYDDPAYRTAISHAVRVVNCMGGQERIDETGEGLRKAILDLHTEFANLVAVHESAWRLLYRDIVQILVEFDREQRAALEEASKAN